MNENEIKELLERMAALEAKNAALENKFNSLEKQVDTINKFVSAITESHSIEMAMSEIESVTKQLSGCDNATFYCYDNSGDKFFSNNGYRDWQDTQSAEELKKVFVSQKIKDNDKKAIIPIVTSKGKSMGVIVAEKSDGFKKRDFDGLKKGSQMMNTIELALKKEYEHQGRITDELTNLKNRQGLNEYLKNTLCGNLNEGKPISIIMCDLDHFKDVNDKYGHEAGDTVLKGVAEVLNDGTRDGADCAFRFGGEELVCIVNCSPEKAIDIAERLREEIENTAHTVMYNDRPTDIKVTASMGVCDIRPNVNIEITPENVREVFDEDFSRADKAAYRAKNSGRNKVVAYDENIYKSYLAEKAAEILCGGENKNIDEIAGKISLYLENGDTEGLNTVTEALQAYAEVHTEMAGIIDSTLSKIETVYTPAMPNQQEAAAAETQPKYYNRDEYKNIQNKTYLNVTAAMAYKISQKAQAENIQHSVKYQGDKSTVTVDGVKDKAFVDEIKKTLIQEQPAPAPSTPQYDTFTDTPPFDDYPPENIPPQTFAFDTAPENFPPADVVYDPPAKHTEEAASKKAPTFYNKEAFGKIENKTYINTDSKTAYEISKEANRQGITHSVKYDGDKSAVTVDGVKNIDFVKAIKNISRWADDVQIKAAKSREQEQKRDKNKGAR